MPKRRHKGDGGITRRHDHPTCPPIVNGIRPEHHCRGRYQGTVQITNPVTGRKVKKYVYGRTSKDVAQKVKATIRQRDTGTLVLQTVTVAVWMTDWLERRRKPPKPIKPQTWRGYETKIKTYIIPHLGRYQLTKLRPEHIEAMYDAMRAAGLAEATLRQTHAILKKALADAIRRDKLAVSPMDKVDAPGTDTNDRAQFTPEQAKHVLRVAGDDARWWLALFYGMRQGEVLGLDWRYVNFAKHTLEIAQTLQTEGGTLTFGTPKSRASRRILPLVPMMEARLRLLWEIQGRPTEGLVFNRDGKPIQPKRDWQAWRDLIDRATVPPFAPLPYIALHAARNSAGTLLEAAKVPDRLAAQILGHAHVKTTHGYQSADVERMAQAFTAVGDLLELE
jgi:integrase